MPTCESDRLVEIILGMAGHRIVTSYTESAPDRHYDIPANGEMRWSQYALIEVDPTVKTRMCRV